MVKQKVTIKNPTGIHLRPAGLLCKEALKFSSHILYEHNGGSYNAKSVLSVLSSCLREGDIIELSCDGEDENEALKYISNLIESGLGE